MSLSQKGFQVLNSIIDHYPTGKFSAKELAAVAEIKVAATTLTSLVNRGFLDKLEGSPAQYKAKDNIIELYRAEVAEIFRKGSNNKNLQNAKNKKNDEFYTKYNDIQNEVKNYTEYFNNKVVYLPCDNVKSQFLHYFIKNFNELKLKKVIATYLDEAYAITTSDGKNIDKIKLRENGDFRSEECKAILKESDIVCTNPPFSLFREFVEWIFNEQKSFLIIGNQNAFTYKEIFNLIKENQIWTGYNMVKEFYQPDGTIKKFGNVCWFTNLINSKREVEIELTKSYNANDYPVYDSCKAIEVNRVANIPKDYNGIMGVPITFIDKYNPNQFEILGMDDPYLEYPNWRGKGPDLNGKTIYRRVMIRRKVK